MENDLSFLKKCLYPPSNYKVKQESLFCLTDYPFNACFVKSQKAFGAGISPGSDVLVGNSGLLENMMINCNSTTTDVSPPAQ